LFVQQLIFVYLYYWLIRKLWNNDFYPSFLLEFL